MFGIVSKQEKQDVIIDDIKHLKTLEKSNRRMFYDLELYDDLALLEMKAKSMGIREDIFEDYTGLNKPMKQRIKDWFYVMYNKYIFMKIFRIKQFFITLGKAIWFSLIDIDGRWKNENK